VVLIMGDLKQAKTPLPVTLGTSENANLAIFCGCYLSQLLHNRTNTDVRGVSWNKKANKWYVHLMANKKQHYIGTFTELYDAASARLKAEQNLNWSSCDSNSSAYQYIKASDQRNKRHGKS